MTKDSSMRDNIDEIPWGGVGIKIIVKIADELSYIRTSDSRNSLFLVKYYHKPGLVQPQHRTQARFFKRALDVLNSFSFWFQKPRKFEGTSNQHLQKISLQLNTDIIFIAVAQALSPIEQLAALPIPEAVLHQCILAVSEAFTNAVRHAHKNLPRESPIELEITVVNEQNSKFEMGRAFWLPSKVERRMTIKSRY